MPRPASPEHQAEMERREERRFLRARDALGCGNMNDLKWYEVFRVLARQQDELTFQMKMVGENRISRNSYFRPVNQRWTDSTNGPFQHRRIEWLEVTGQGAERIRKSIEGLGKMPLVGISNGFRLQAYGLLHEATDQENKGEL